MVWVGAGLVVVSGVMAAREWSDSLAPERVSFTVPPLMEVPSLIDQTRATETRFAIKIKNGNNRAIRIVGLTWC
jgi:hypothetical protein